MTVTIDLTGIRDRSGQRGCLDMVEGRSKQVFKTWLNEREETWREAVEVVATSRSAEARKDSLMTK